MLNFENPLDSSEVIDQLSKKLLYARAYGNIDSALQLLKDNPEIKDTPGIVDAFRAAASQLLEQQCISNDIVKIVEQYPHILDTMKNQAKEYVDGWLATKNPAALSWFFDTILMRTPALKDLIDEKNISLLKESFESGILSGYLFLNNKALEIVRNVPAAAELLTDSELVTKVRDKLGQLLTNSEGMGGNATFLIDGYFTIFPNLRTDPSTISNRWAGIKTFLENEKVNDALYLLEINPSLKDQFNNDPEAIREVTNVMESWVEKRIEDIPRLFESFPFLKNSMDNPIIIEKAIVGLKKSVDAIPNSVLFGILKLFPSLAEAASDPEVTQALIAKLESSLTAGRNSDDDSVGVYIEDFNNILSTFPLLENNKVVLSLIKERDRLANSH